MKPLNFPESNCRLVKPEGWKDEECGDLHCYREKSEDRPRFISKWRMSWRERVKLLMTGTVWFHAFQFTHPPIFIGVDKPFEVPINQRWLPKWVKRWMTRRAIRSAMKQADTQGLRAFDKVAEGL